MISSNHYINLFNLNLSSVHLMKQKKNMFLYNLTFGLCLLVIVLCVQGGQAQITCYQCNTYTDYNKTRCLDPIYPDKVPTGGCPSNYVCTKVSYYADGTFVTSRSCDPKTSDTCKSIEDTLKDNYLDLSSYQCSACEKDLCNLGFNMLSSITFVVSTVLFVTIF